jgi:hypothetical protein
MVYVGPDLDLYRAIVRRYGALARVVVVSIGLVAFVVLQVLASTLGGAFAPLIVRSPAVWATISIVSWIAVSASVSFSLLQYTRDLHKSKELLGKIVVGGKEKSRSINSGRKRVWCRWAEVRSQTLV